MRQKGDLPTPPPQKQETKDKPKVKIVGAVSTSEMLAATPVRRHRGDIMSTEKRSALMSRIRGKGTAPELMVAGMLDAAGYVYESHVKDLPGRPDFVLKESRVVIVVDGDFWHGWKFSEWRDKLSPKWEAKIEANRRRDFRNIRELRRLGWKVVRLWEHQLKKSPARCLARIKRTVEASVDIKEEIVLLNSNN